MSKLDKDFNEKLKIIESLSSEEKDKILSELLKDPLLSDLPKDVTSEYVNTLIKLETGQLYEVYIVKKNNDRISMILI